MRAKLTLLIVVLALMVAPLSGRMAPVIWSLSGVTFEDGGTASGTFTYDAGTNSYSAVAINTTAGSIRGAAAYSFAHPLSDPTFLVVTAVNPAGDLTGQPAMALLFVAPLTDLGGSIPIAPASSEVTCPNATCMGVPPSAQRLVTAGSVFATGVPVPTMPQWFAIILAVGLVAGAAWKLRGRLNTSPAL